MTYIQNNDQIWKALADPNRRRILDLVCEQSLTTGQIVDSFEGMGRTGVMKHISILEAAELILVHREGTLRWNSFNPNPMLEACLPWLERHRSRLEGSAHALRRLAESSQHSEQPDQNKNIYNEAES